MGPEFRAPLSSAPPWVETTCTRRDGSSVTLELRIASAPPPTGEDCLPDDDDFLGEVVVTLRDAKGVILREPFVASVEPTHAFNDHAATVTCLANGSFVAAWQQAAYLGGRLAARAFDGTGMPVTGEIVVPESDSWWYPVSEAASTPADRRSVWLAYLAAGGVRMVRIDAVTGAVSAPLLMMSGELFRDIEIAAHDDQVAIAWRENFKDVYAAIAVPEAGYHARPIKVNTFPTIAYGSVGAVAVAPGNADLFEVSWFNESQGGRVGRRIAIEALTQATTTTSTTTTTVENGGIRFSNRGALDRADDEHWIAFSSRGRPLAGDQTGTWLATWTRRSRKRPDPALDTNARSTDDGRHWSLGAPIRLPDDGWLDYDVHMAADGAGGSLQLWWAWGRDPYALRASRSADGGRTWTEPAVIHEPRSLAGIPGAGPVAADVTSVEPGTWLAAASDTVGYVFPPPLEASTVTILGSDDGGATWEVREELWRTSLLSWGGALALAANRERAFVVWAEGDGLMLSTSRDAGRSWSAARRMHESDVRYGESSPERGAVESLEAAIDPHGNAVVVWRAQGLWGADGDIAHVRSHDGGETWSLPAPVAAYVDDDDAEDAEPSLAVDATGTWVLTWPSHWDGGGRWGMDRDILFASSTDAGATWSAPGLISDDFRDDDLSNRSAWVATSLPGVFGVLWTQEVEDEAPVDVTLLFASTNLNCGNGSLDPGERCDDGNTTDGDGCDHNCRPTGCGNSVADPSEECDDGNDDDADDCLSTCVRAACGDGFLQRGVEQCDDGNALSTDSCTAECRHAACGDGFVFAGREECDDGNASRFDACLPTCEAARCGDGVVWPGVERCDDGNDVDGDSCSNECVFSAGCLNTPSGPLASDAQDVLRYAIGLTDACAFVTCDLDHDGRSTAADAMVVLRQATGAHPWQCAGEELVVRLVSPVVLEVLQVTVDYRSAFSGIARRQDGTLDCDVGSYGFVADEGALRVAVVGIDGFSGPADLAVCRMEGAVTGVQAVPVFLDDVLFLHDDSPDADLGVVAFRR